MFVDDSDEAGDTSATIVLSKLLATNDDIYSSTEYSWLLDMVNYTLQVIMSPCANVFLAAQTLPQFCQTPSQ